MDGFKTLLSELSTTEMPNYIFDRIGQAFGSYENINLSILKGIFKNQDLFDVLSANCTYITTNFDEILRLRNSNTMIYVQQLNLYGVISMTGHKELCKHLSIRNINPKIYQLVMTNEKQKVVLLCDNSMKKPIESKFAKVLGENVHIAPGENKCEITLQNKFVDNYDEIRDIYMDIITKMSANMSNIGEYLTMIMPIIGVNNYIKYDISDAVKKDITKEILANILKTPNVLNTPPVVQFTGPVSNVNMNINSKIVQPKEKHEETKAWIAENLPDDISKPDYYKMYLGSSVPVKVSACMFGRIMAEIGYIEKSKNKKRFWKIIN